jgi:hypothetical protein
MIVCHVSNAVSTHAQQEPHFVAQARTCRMSVLPGEALLIA